MTRVFITGSSGCLGSSLIALLNRHQIEVTGLVLKNASCMALNGLQLDLVEGDILDMTSLKTAMKGADWVFHLAAIADDWRYPQHMIYRTNVKGTFNVLQAARELGVERVVVTSSAAVLGIPRPDKPLMDETCSYNLDAHRWIYGHSKVLAERIVQNFLSRGMWITSILPTAIMGPGDQNFISGQLIARAVRGETFPFPNGGANFIDVRDVAEAFFQAAVHGSSGERYLLAGNNLSHLHCLGSIADVLRIPVNYLQMPNILLPFLGACVDGWRRIGGKAPIDAGRVFLSGRYMYYDPRKARETIGLRTRPFENTIEDAYRWYVDNGLLPGICGGRHTSMPSRREKLLAPFVR